MEHESRLRERGRPGRWTAIVSTLVAAAIAAAVVAATSGARATATPPSNTSAPSIDGAVQVGGTLTASPGSWSGDTPISFSYTWQRCDGAGSNCTAIVGATAQTYSPLSADAGSTLRVNVQATNAAGVSSALSSATAPVAAAGSLPTNTVAPSVSGSAVQGQTLTVSQGTWSGPTPITFKYQWRRCDGTGNNCADASSVITANTITLAAADVGHTIRGVVIATNSGGSTTATSAPSTVVTASANTPVGTVSPSVSGSAVQGQTLTVGQGTWSGPTPITFTYQWRRCDGTGNNCADASSVITANTITLAATDVGHTIRGVVIATNSAGSTTATSAPSAVVSGTTAPAGAQTLPDGRVSVPASSVSLPQRLIISRVAFTPSRLAGRSPFTMSVWVTDTRGYAVRDVLVLATGLPYGWVYQPGEAGSGTDGSVSFTVRPTVNMPVRNAALVVFVRARKEGDDILAGVSTRRLVQVSIG